MNEYLIASTNRNLHARGASADERRIDRLNESVHAEAGCSQQRKCGLDTGARGWRYAYQTH